MDKVLILVELINDLTNENWNYCLSGINAREYFKNGGCYEFLKVLKHFYPEGTIMMRKDYEHCAYLVEDNIYDCSGVCNSDEFVEASELDIEKLEDPYLYGRIEVKFEGKKPSDALIEEIYLCFPEQDFPFKQEVVKR